MNSKEAIQELQILLYNPDIDVRIISKENQLLDIIKKDLEVLEIIKNKLVFPLALMSLPCELYNDSVMKEQQLTQKEYNKVKEFLKS